MSEQIRRQESGHVAWSVFAFALTAKFELSWRDLHCTPSGMDMRRLMRARREFGDVATGDIRDRQEASTREPSFASYAAQELKRPQSYFAASGKIHQSSKATGPANRTLSSKSSRPPKPGIRFEASFFSQSRLISDSQRSPIKPTSPSTEP